MSEFENSEIFGDRRWRVSSYCQNSNCVQVDITSDGVLVRDSKLADSPVLRFTPQEWKDFIDGVYAGEFDQD